jgi:HPr kinase/phosphorylase
MSDGGGDRLHGTCVAVGDDGVLLLGESGAGKSDVALRLIDGGARLVADDQTLVERCDGGVRASAPASIAGRIEARGVGILDLPQDLRTAQAALALVVELAPDEEIERLPEPRTRTILGVALPCLRLDPHDASVTAKIRLALRARRPD